MRFRTVTLLTTVFFGGLAVGLITSPEYFAGTFGLIESDGATVMARRAGVLFIGLAGLIYASRGLPPGKARRKASIAMTVMFLSLILLGLYDLIRGAVGWGIFAAITPEIVFTLLYVRLLRQS